MFNPTTQREAWKEKGWLGEKVAGSITRTGTWGKQLNGNGPVGGQAPSKVVDGPKRTTIEEEENSGPSTTMGNKWQQAGVFAVDGRGVVVRAQKALRADDCLDMESAVKSLGL